MKLMKKLLGKKKLKKLDEKEYIKLCEKIVKDSSDKIHKQLQDTKKKFAFVLGIAIPDKGRGAIVMASESGPPNIIMGMCGEIVQAAFKKDPSALAQAITEGKKAMEKLGVKEKKKDDKPIGFKMPDHKTEQ